MVRFLPQGGFSFYGRVKLKNEIDSARGFCDGPIRAVIKYIFLGNKEGLQRQMGLNGI